MKLWNDSYHLPFPDRIEDGEQRSRAIGSFSSSCAPIRIRKMKIEPSAQERLHAAKEAL
jgi:hypothetical protein